jgi:hypothetical protein
MSTQLTAQQTLQLANIFARLLSEIGDFRHAHFHDLSPAEASRLKEAMDRAADTSRLLFNHTVLLAGEEATQSIQALQEVTEELDRLSTVREKTQQWLDIAGAVISLAAGILTHDPSALGGIGDLINQISTAIDPTTGAAITA